MQNLPPSQTKCKAGWIFAFVPRGCTGCRRWQYLSHALEAGGRHSCELAERQLKPGTWNRALVVGGGDTWGFWCTPSGCPLLMVFVFQIWRKIAGLIQKPNHVSLCSRGSWFRVWCLSPVGKSMTGPPGPQRTRGADVGGMLERLNSKWGLAGLRPRKTSCSSRFLNLFNPRRQMVNSHLWPRHYGWALPKGKHRPISQPFPESGQFLHRPPEASVSCPISEYLPLPPLFCISVMPRMKGSWFVKAHQYMINKMYSNPVTVLCSLRHLDMIFQGYKHTSRAPIAKRKFKHWV